MTAQDFADWKRHPITQIIYAQIADLIEQGKDELTASAGVEPTMDARKAGKIQAFQAILDIEIEGDSK